MADLKRRIVEYLKSYPKGLDDDQLAQGMDLSQRQTANQYCRRMEREGLIVRRKVGGKIRNFVPSDKDMLKSVENPQRQSSLHIDIWYWEGNVQAKVRDYLESCGYSILAVADTRIKERGRDIEAIKDGRRIWITAKGFPVETNRTPATVQAGHWFKDAMFDLLIWYGIDKTSDLGLALPDFRRYRKLLEKVQWLQGMIGFSVFWVSDDGSVSVSQVIGP